MTKVIVKNFLIKFYSQSDFLMVRLFGVKKESLK